MKILYSIRGLRGREGGATYFVASLSSKMAQLGHHVDILVEETDCGIPAGVGNVYVRGKIGNDGLRKLMCRYDIVHDNGVWLPFNHAVAVASQKVGTPRIVSPHGAMMPWIMAQRRWKKWLGWKLYQKRDLHSAELVLSTASLETLAIRRAGYSGPVKEIPLAVDPPGPAMPKSVKKMRQALFLSRIHPKKGIHDLVSAWKDLSPNGWRLIVVGPDDLGMRAELEAMSQGAAISWLGPIFGEDRLRVFQESDLYVLPTYSENFGITVIEAMLMELPVLTTTETPWENIEKMGFGWVIRPGKNSLLSRLEDVLKEPNEILEKYGKSGRKWAEANFSWDSILVQLEKTYLSVVNSVWRD